MQVSPLCTLYLWLPTGALRELGLGASLDSKTGLFPCLSIRVPCGRKPVSLWRRLWSHSFVPQALRVNDKGSWLQEGSRPRHLGSYNPPNDSHCGPRAPLLQGSRVFLQSWSAPDGSNAIPLPPSPEQLGIFISKTTPRNQGRQPQAWVTGLGWGLLPLLSLFNLCLHLSMNNLVI